MFHLAIRTFLVLSFSICSELWYPQKWQILDDGSNLPIEEWFFLTILIYILILLQNSPRGIIYRLAKCWFLNMPLTFRVLTVIVWFSQRIKKRIDVENQLSDLLFSHEVHNKFLLIYHIIFVCKYEKDSTINWRRT